MIIEISDDTLNNLGKWPLPRDFHASLINVLKEFGVKSIVFDILFSEPTEHDDVFSEAIREAGNVYLPVAFYLPAVSPGRSDPAVESPGLLAGPRDLFVKSAKGTGHINVFVDSDGKVRSVPLFVRFDNKIFPQLALKVANDYLGAGHFDLKAVVPFQVNYPGLWETSFRHLSYFEVLKSYSGLKKGIKSELDLSLLKNKICFIGLTATGTSDLQPVPLENIYPLVGLQASVLNSILTGKFIRDTGILPNTLINLFLFFACLIICIRFAPLRAFFGALGLAAAYFILALVLFIFGLWVGLFNPLLILAATYIVITLYRFLAEIRRRELLEKELEIAREIQKSFLPEDVKMPQGLPVFVSFEPARFVAGDLYDIHKISADKGGVLLGDVSGKGVPAALIMAQAISIFRLFSRNNPACGEVLTKLNAELYEKLSGRFITGVYLVIDSKSGSAVISSAGHLPVILYHKKTGAITELDGCGGLPLGVMEGALYEGQSFKMEEQDKVVFFTDGVTEARNINGEEFGIDRLKELVLAGGGLPGKELLEKIKFELHKFAKGAKQHDDISLIILEMQKS